MQTLCHNNLRVPVIMTHHVQCVYVLLHGVVCVILCLAVLVQYRLLTDGQTDTATTYRPTCITVVGDVMF